jgi:hypothetical protein
MATLSAAPDRMAPLSSEHSASEVTCTATKDNLEPVNLIALAQILITR